LKVSEDGAGVSVAITVKVTGTLSWPLVLPQEVVGEQVKTTAPWYVPVAKVLATPVTIDTVSLPGVAPPEGNACSQLPPEVVETATLYEMAVLPELVIPSVVLGDEPGV
jgi:hypothetical protein